MICDPGWESQMDSMGLKGLGLTTWPQVLLQHLTV